MPSSPSLHACRYGGTAFVGVPIVDDAAVAAPHQLRQPGLALGKW